MDRRERYQNQSETMRMALESNQAQLWTALPGIVARFPGTAGGKMTVDVQPTIRGRVLDKKGKASWQQMPVLLDCPIVWQGGGGVTATFPIKAATVVNGVSQKDGDECLVVFASRCIDAWWQLGGIQNQPELRMHNLSDGFAIVGLRSDANSFAVDTQNACLITDDGQTYFKLNPTAKSIAVQATGGINLNGVTIDQNGNISTPQTIHAAGNINSDATVKGATDVIAGTISGKTHTHVDPQGGVVGPPQ